VGEPASFRPLPGDSKQKEVRYLGIREDGQLDEAQFAAWVKQCSQLPEERMVASALTKIGLYHG
jgi:hypothetical protein